MGKGALAGRQRSARNRRGGHTDLRHTTIIDVRIHDKKASNCCNAAARDNRPLSGLSPGLSALVCAFSSLLSVP
jgi:hypothetical protein